MELMEWSVQNKKSKNSMIKLKQIMMMMHFFDYKFSLFNDFVIKYYTIF